MGKTLKSIQYDVFDEFIATNHRVCYRINKAPVLLEGNDEDVLGYHKKIRLKDLNLYCGRSFEFSYDSDVNT